jgi:GH15 family glucan-1,4-alpha-glucosidase
MALTSPVAAEPRRDGGFAPIEDYAVISDQRTAALVARDGAIDWMCAPRFDDAPVFARLLDAERGGTCTMHPTEPFTAAREYVEDTNILQTTFRTQSGAVRVTDALVVSGRIQRFSQLVRKVECLAGEVELVWAVGPRCGWECAHPDLRGLVGHPYVFAHEQVEIAVQAFDLGQPMTGEGEVTGTARLRAGDSGLLSMLFTHSFPLLASDRGQCEERLTQTVAFWNSWLATLAYEGPWNAAVRRSALALGACVHDQTGAMVAAPTTSLPEVIGGSRNFDYRYCWLRDTSFALDAALRLGLSQFAQATLGWMLRAERHTHPRLNVFFDLGGQPFVPQNRVDLQGYRDSRPVLSGNDAGSQLQLGSYGDLMETAYLFVKSGSILDAYSGLHLAEAADHLCQIWRDPDSGIWELSDKRDYTHSKIQCWLALDRACEMAERRQLERSRVEQWRRTQGEIGGWVTERCIDAEGILRRDGNGSGELDCALLLAPRSNWVDARDERFVRTIDAIRSGLGAGGPLLYRYSGMQEEENAFVACSFWMVEALARAGRLDEAAEMMDELVGFTNDVGLLSEEIDPADRSLRGNFPLCLSHLSLLNAAAVHAAEGGCGDTPNKADT